MALIILIECILIRRSSSSFKHNASFVARLPTIRRHKSQSLHSPGAAPIKTTGSTGIVRGSAIRCRGMNDINMSAENLGMFYIIYFVKYTFYDLKKNTLALSVSNPSNYTRSVDRRQDILNLFSSVEKKS